VLQTTLSFSLINLAKSYLISLLLLISSVNATSIDPSLAEKVFCDILFTSRHQKKPIHNKLKKLGSHITHELT
jgi:hypothetical protein